MGGKLERGPRPAGTAPVWRFRVTEKRDVIIFNIERRVCRLTVGRLTRSMMASARQRPLPPTRISTDTSAGLRQLGPGGCQFKLNRPESESGQAGVRVSLSHDIGSRHRSRHRRRGRAKRGHGPSRPKPGPASPRATACHWQPG